MPCRIGIAIGSLLALFVTDFAASPYSFGVQAGRLLTLAKGDATVPVW